MPAPRRRFDAAVRDLVMRYGWNSTAYQILNPGIDHWLNEGGSAAVGYTQRNGFLLAAGAPVCKSEGLSAAVKAFEEFAREYNCRVCYVCAADRLRELLAESKGHSTIAIGAQPVWDPREWAGIVARRASLRAQIQRARNKGVTVATADPRGSDELRQTLSTWLQSRALPPMHFLVEPEALDARTPDRFLLVARRKGAMAAYLLASPVAARNGFLIEQVVRSPDAPNGTSELLIHSAMTLFAEQGREYCTLGLVALAGNASGEMQGNPGWLRAMMTIARRHANRFYNFEGLENFRAKMSPQRWEAIYAISNETNFSPFALYAIGAAFSGISPWRAIGIAVVKGVRQEISSLGAKK